MNGPLTQQDGDSLEELGLREDGSEVGSDE